VADYVPVVILCQEDLAHALTRVQMPEYTLDQPIHRVHVAADLLAQDLDQRLAHTDGD